MTDRTFDEIRRNNDDLRKVVVRMATIIRDGFVERRLLAATRGADIAPCLLAAVTPVNAVDHLRELALLCSHLSRDDRNGPAAQALEDLGTELATEAGDLAALLRLTAADRPCVG